MSRVILEAWTDGATLCAFDPGALPKDFDHIVGDDPIGVVEDLERQERAWLGGTGSDGSFVIHAYIEEPIPPFPNVSETDLVLVKDFPSFACPTGVLYISGLEYMARYPEVGSAFTPKGGLGREGATKLRVAVTPGKCRLRIFEFKGVVPQPPRSFSVAGLLGVLSWLSIVIGGISAVGGVVTLLLVLLIKLVQTITGNPLAHERWYVAGVALLTLVAGALLVGIGLGLLRLYQRSPAGKAEDEAKLQSPDFIFEVTTL